MNKNRRFVTPKGYYSYDDFYCWLKQNTIYLDIKFKDESPILMANYLKKATSTTDTYLLTNIVNYTFRTHVLPPTYCLDKTLTEALINSTPPKNSQIQNVFVNAGVILFPLEIQADVKYCFFYVEEDAVIVMGESLKGRTFLFRFPLFEQFNVDQISHRLDNDKVEAMSNEVRLRGNLIHQIFLYKQLVPEKELSYSEQAHHGLIIPDKKKGSVFNYNPKKLTPIMIGKEYRIKRENHQTIGTHASPTTHWRSGHWRQQPIGTREQPDHKTIWIEPVLINA